jgi:hypothetical protein
VVCWRRKG